MTLFRTALLSGLALALSGAMIEARPPSARPAK
jgi:hypothetical protein